MDDQRDASEAKPVDPPAPAATSGGVMPDDNRRHVVDAARRLLARGGTLESTNAGAPIDDAPLVEALERVLGAAVTNVSPATPGDYPVRAFAARSVLRAARQAVEEVASGGAPSNLTDLQYASLEAVVHVIGRPAVRYTNGKIQLPPSDLGENERWTVIIANARRDINRVSASVGRVAFATFNGGAGFLGTGWRVGPDLIVTNRHVVRRIVANPSEAVATWVLDSTRPVTVDFAATDGAAAAASLPVAALVHCAPEDDVDVAILRIRSGGDSIPPPLALDFAPEAVVVQQAAGFEGQEVYVVGHPYRQLGSSVTTMVFGAADGLKRWAPGLVTQLVDGLRLIEHDCSTLGGNSGSCVFNVETHKVVGVHVGGRGVNELTSRGAANVAVALCRLGSHPVTPLLQH